MEKDMKVVLNKNNPTQGIDLQQEGIKTVLNYGTRHQNTDLTTIIDLIGFPPDVILNSTCGCTTSAGGNGTYTIRYDAKNLGQFGKTMTVTTKNGTLLQTITLRGTIVR